MAHTESEVVIMVALAGMEVSVDIIVMVDLEDMADMVLEDMVVMDMEFMAVMVLEVMEGTDLEVMIALDMEVMMIRMGMMMMTTIMMTEMIVVITLCHSHVPYRKVQATSAHPKTFMETQFKLRNHS